MLPKMHIDYPWYLCIRLPTSFHELCDIYLCVLSFKYKHCVEQICLYFTSSMHHISIHHFSLFAHSAHSLEKKKGLQEGHTYNIQVVCQLAFMIKRKQCSLCVLSKTQGEALIKFPRVLEQS